MQKPPHISIVTPVYGCAESLPLLYKRLVSSLTHITNDFEIIMINDASPDNAWDIITSIAENDIRVKGIRLSRNFGQHHAITAGLDHAFGEWVVVMDCDLQDQPEEIVKLYDKAQEGYDVVFGRRNVRQDNIYRRLSSRLFHKLFTYLTEIDTDMQVANFSIVSQRVVKNFRNLKEQTRTYVLFLQWLGFKQARVDINHAERTFGKSSYNFTKMLNLAIDSVVSQSNKPLKISIKFGFSLSIASLIYAFWLVADYLFFSSVVQGWTSVMVSIYFLAGLMLATMGFLGLYIGKIFDETKARPIYIISDKVNLSKPQE